MTEKTELSTIDYIEIKKIRRMISFGFMLLGCGVGIICGNALAGCLIGLGMGLLISSLIKYKGQ